MKTHKILICITSGFTVEIVNQPLPSMNVKQEENKFKV